MKYLVKNDKGTYDEVNIKSVPYNMNNIFLVKKHIAQLLTDHYEDKNYCWDEAWESKSFRRACLK